MAEGVNASVKLKLAGWNKYLRRVAALICVASVTLCASPAFGQWPVKAFGKASEAIATAAPTEQDISQPRFAKRKPRRRRGW